MFKKIISGGKTGVAQRALDWVSRNKTWLFQGIIAAILLSIVSIVTIFWSSKSTNHNITNYYGISEEKYETIVEKYAITRKAIESYLDIIGKKIDVTKDPDAKTNPEEIEKILIEAAKSYKEIKTALERFQSDDPKVNEHKLMARKELEEGNFDKAETHINEAAKIDIEASKNFEQIAQKRLRSAAKSMAENGKLMLFQEKYTSAASYLKQAIDLHPNKFDSDMVNYIDERIEVSILIGDFGHIEQSLRRVIDILNKAEDKDNYTLANHFLALGILYHFQKRFIHVESLYLKAIGLMEDFHETKKSNIVLCNFLLASLYHSERRYEKAESLYLRLLDDVKTFAFKEETNKDLLIATIENKTAEVLKSRGKDVEAKIAQDHALSIWSRTYNSERADIFNEIIDRNTDRFYYIWRSILWEMSHRQERYTECEKNYKMTLFLKEQLFGKSHPATAKTLEDLAWVYYRINKFKEAEKLFERLLKIREKITGLKSIKTADNLNNLGWVNYELGLYNKAQKLFERSLDILENSEVTDSLSIADNLAGLGWINYDFGKYKEAEKLCERVLKIRQDELGSDYIQTGWAFKA